MTAIRRQNVGALLMQNPAKLQAWQALLACAAVGYAPRSRRDLALRPNADIRLSAKGRRVQRGKRRPAICAHRALQDVEERCWF
ncbi:hypothetical protein CA260_10395 [Dyella jiangningensis]|uniref:Uncharacterized protein n=1 Tax=Dyella jiangningensis TaxID=1379159 RepID=A0A328PDU1_9GAMM|nr:hypothetical protein CA260_10395 [Dyella jiangningensis]